MQVSIPTSKCPNLSKHQMWQANNFTENEDSDLSISDEVDFGDDLPEDCISLGGTSEKKGEVQVLSQLEMLRDGRELVQETKHTIFAQKRQTDIFAEDDVEFPIFTNENHFFFLPKGAVSCNLYEDIISDDELRENKVRSTKFITSGAENCQRVRPPNSGSTRDAEACTWSAANREAEALLHLNENAGRFSSRPVFAKGNMSLKAIISSTAFGGQGKSKPRFSFHSHSHKEDLLWDVNEINESGVSSKGGKIEDSKIHEDTAELAIRHDSTRHSMVELLGCFQDNDAQPLGIEKRTQRKGAQLAFKRGISSLGDRNIDDGPEGLDSGSSNDDEDKHQNLKLIIPASKRKTMVDQFQEALGAASTSGEGHLIALPSHSSIGLFGKLQQVMQREKERDADFSNRLLMEDKGKSIDVEILSRCLEAKLTVCSCSCIGNNEGTQLMDNHHMMKETRKRTLTIIFSSRICSDVELEVGNLIRVYPPWKEVNVMGKEGNTILSAYFSQL